MVMLYGGRIARVTNQLFCTLAVAVRLSNDNADVLAPCLFLSCSLTIFAPWLNLKVNTQ